MKKITKVEARKLFKDGAYIYLLPSKYNCPSHFDGVEGWFISSDGGNEFESTVKRYEGYFCNAENGKNASYWIYREGEENERV